MKRTTLVVGAIGALAMLSACGGGYGYHGAAYAGGPDVWYDGYYGDYGDGYWGPDAAFYYRGHDGNYQRDAGNHFRRSQFNGAHGFHAGHAPAAAPAGPPAGAPAGGPAEGRRP